jgi:hypothetical protein
MPQETDFLMVTEFTYTTVPCFRSSIRLDGSGEMTPEQIIFEYERSASLDIAFGGNQRYGA